MELGVQVVGPYDHVVRVAQICEKAGIAAVALADHYLYGRSAVEFAAPTYDSLIQTAALGRDTSTVEIVMLVSPITFRHPAVYAKTITTVDEISGGRFVFGLGTGWHDAEHEIFGFAYPDMSARFAWLEDALGYLRAYLDDPTSGYDGQYWSLEGRDLNPRARRGLRLLVGGGGVAKTPDLVGRFANEYNLYHHTAEGIAERLEVMRSAASKVGRDPDEIVISTCYPMIGGADDREIDEFIGDFAASRGLDAATVKEQLGERVPMKTWDDHAEQLETFRELGFSRVYFQVIGGVAWATENALDSLAR
jgi:alkanesulfonate monooxygenase SsuD/methylene tetrahydromethanopterin reductase-like flavin-dependent oxidoreductase (luciferase family)